MIPRSTRPDRAAAAPTLVAADRPSDDGRVYTLGIWSLGFGYFVFYAPYAALTKATTLGLMPGLEAPASPLDMLPVIGLTTAAVVTAVVTSLGWWRYCAFVPLGRWRLPRPARQAAVAGLATAAIIYATTVMFTFSGVSIVLALVIMRGGVLVLAPLLDLAYGRRVRWFAWIGLMLALSAAMISALPGKHELHWVVAATAALYLAAYAVRLRCLNALAKTADGDVSRRYFVEEQLVAMATLVLLPLVLAVMGDTAVARHLRYGLTTFPATSAVWPAVGIGALYAGLYCFGTRIYLDRRENTFCVTLNRSASLLAGVLASLAVSGLFGAPAPAAHEFLSAALILAAMFVLSPAHHAFESAVAGWRGSPLVSAPAPAAPLEREGEWR